MFLYLKLLFNKKMNLFQKLCGSTGAGCCNQSIQKSEAKVVHSFDIEDLGKQSAFCRCWKSSKVTVFFLF